MKIKYLLLSVAIMLSLTVIAQPYIYGEINMPTEIKEPKRFLKAYQLIKENERGVSFFEHKTRQTFAITVGNMLLVEDALSFNDSDGPMLSITNTGGRRILLYYGDKANNYTKSFISSAGKKYNLPKVFTPIAGAKMRAGKFRKVTDEEIDRSINFSYDTNYQNDLGIFVYYDEYRGKFTVTYGEDVLAQNILVINNFEMGNIVDVYRNNTSLDTLLTWKNGRIIFHQGDSEIILPKSPQKTLLQKNGKFVPPIIEKEDNQNTQISFQNPTIEKKDEEIKFGEIYDIVEIMPNFKGGLYVMDSFVKANLKYPPDAKEIGISGRVIVSFLVSETGELSDIKVQRSLYPSCDKEAIRIVKSMPKWIPAETKGVPVPAHFVMQVLFRE